MDDRANPAPLGLTGFGMTTILLNIHNAGFFGMDVMILAMGLFYGGIAQIIAGTLEFRKNNTFGMTAFISYGSFWLTLAFILAFQGDGVLNRDTGFFGWYLAMWGLFTLYMFVGTLKKNRALQVIFGTLVALFFLLAIADWTGSETITRIAGWEGIFCGASAFYLAAAEVINESYGKELLPVGV